MLFLFFLFILIVVVVLIFSFLAVVFSIATRVLFFNSFASIKIFFDNLFPLQFCDFEPLLEDIFSTLCMAAMSFFRVLAKLLLHDSCVCPIFLGWFIHVPKNCFGRVLSGKATIFPIQHTIFLSINASILGILQKSLLTHEFFLCCSLTWSHLIFSSSP